MMSMMMGGARYGLGGASGMTSPGMTSSLPPDPPSPTHSDSSNAANISPTSPSGPMRGLSKECGVCGDVAKSMHFGGLSCDSCKAFFRRSVQNNAYKGFSCPYEKNCVIGVSSRKACQYCRFEKCISIGMEKGWVMSEDERRKMMEQRKKKNKSGVEGVPKSPEPGMYSLSEEDRNEIARIVALYKKAYNTVPYGETAEGEAIQNAAASSTSQGNNLILPWMTFCQRIAYFFSLFRDFAELATSDQSLLLKTALTSAGIIMGSVVYDSNSGKWAAKINRNRSANMPNISNQSVEKLVPGELFTRVDKFFKKFQKICPDETMAIILILVVLYSPELMGLEAKERVQVLQVRYILILENYVKYIFREKSSNMFSETILSLVAIRELADRTGQMRLHEMSTCLFPGKSPNPGMFSPSLGSPYSGLSLSSPHPPSQPSSSKGELVSTNKSHQQDPKNDPNYQRILNLIYQMHSSSLNTHTPTVLPIIIQILTKWAHAKQEGKSIGKAVTGSPRRAHRHTRTKAHRGGSSHRSRRPSFKRELSLPEELPLSIKEEVMDHSEDALLSLTPDLGHPYSEPQYGTTMSSQEIIGSYPQQHQQQSPFGQLQSTTLIQPSNPNLSHTAAAPLYQQQQPMPDLSPQPPDPTFLSTTCHSPFRMDEGTLSYSHNMSPEDEFRVLSQHPPQSSLSHSTQHQTQLLSHNPNIQVTESLQMPPVSPFPSSSSTQISSPPLNAGALYQQQDSQSSFTSSIGPSLSPYSSSSSSNSPEETEAPQGGGRSVVGISSSSSSSSSRGSELQDLTETEMDVLMQLMDRVSNFDLQGRVTTNEHKNIQDILPMQLMQELQSKLCRFSTASSPSPDLAMEVGPFQGGSEPPIELPHHSLEMGICMDMDSGTPGRMTSALGMGTTSCMDMCTDTMEVDSTHPLDSGT